MILKCRTTRWQGLHPLPSHLSRGDTRDFAIKEREGTKAKVSPCHLVYHLVITKLIYFSDH